MPLKGEVLYEYCPKHPGQKRVLKWGRLRCTICQKAATNRAQKTYDKGHPERRSQNHRVQSMRQYGMTIEDKEVLWLSQEKQCKICQSPITLWARSKNDPLASYVDHDHKTGKVRGLLCAECNFALGKFRDDEERLRSAIRYLGGELCPYAA